MTPVRDLVWQHEGVGTWALCQGNMFLGSVLLRADSAQQRAEDSARDTKRIVLSKNSLLSHAKDRCGGWGLLDGPRPKGKGKNKSITR